MEFDGIYQSYFRDVFLYLRSLSASETVAEEIAQETFMKALKSIRTFDGEKDIRAWLFTIAKNTYFTFCKRENIYADKEEFENAVSQKSNFEEKLADEESAFSIHRFLHKMQEPYKEVFSLRVFGELPFEKIGTLFGKSADWARVTFYRAKKQIIEYMEEMENED